MEKYKFIEGKPDWQLTVPKELTDEQLVEIEKFIIGKAGKIAFTLAIASQGYHTIESVEDCVVFTNPGLTIITHYAKINKIVKI